LSPAGDRFFDEPGFGVMLCEELGLAVHQLRGTGFERLGDLRVQLLPGAAQQAVVSRVLHQRVLEAIDRIGRDASLEDQLGSNEASESGLQLVFGETGDGTQ
jgi:type II secretory ATPase GspE/PulE/Tfp pilus assembly ATPase PilB-like protein